MCVLCADVFVADGQLSDKEKKAAAKAAEREEARAAQEEARAAREVGEEVRGAAPGAAVAAQGVAWGLRAEATSCGELAPIVEAAASRNDVELCSCPQRPWHALPPMRRLAASASGQEQ